MNRRSFYVSNFVLRFFSFLPLISSSVFLVAGDSILCAGSKCHNFHASLVFPHLNYFLSFDIVDIFMDHQYFCKGMVRG